MRLRITGGEVHDQANGVDGDIRDICVEDGRIVESLPPDAPKLDARGMVVMPGGVDVHSHFASSSCNQARRLIPDEHTADPVAHFRPVDRRNERLRIGKVLCKRERGYGFEPWLDPANSLCPVLINTIDRALACRLPSLARVPSTVTASPSLSELRVQPKRRSALGLPISKPQFSVLTDTSFFASM